MPNSKRMYRVTMIETGPPGRTFHMGIGAGEHEAQAIDAVKKENASMLRRLECGPDSYRFEATEIK